MLIYQKVNDDLIIVSNSEYSSWIKKVDGLWCAWGRLDEPIEYGYQRFLNKIDEGDGGSDFVYDLYEPYQY